MNVELLSKTAGEDPCGAVDVIRPTTRPLTFAHEFEDVDGYVSRNSAEPVESIVSGSFVRSVEP
jgi:hypothetical protein